MEPNIFIDINQSALFSAYLGCSKVHSYGSQNSTSWRTNRFLSFTKLTVCLLCCSEQRIICQVINNHPRINKTKNLPEK